MVGEKCQLVGKLTYIPSKLITDIFHIVNKIISPDN